jgi:hypothetical protein
VPVIAFAIAVRAGSADGLATPRLDWATAGLSTFVGDAAREDGSDVRAVDPATGALGFMLGAAPLVLRCGVNRETCVAVLADWTSRLC